MTGEVFVHRHGDLTCRVARRLAPEEEAGFAAFVAGSPAAAHQQMPAWPAVAPVRPHHHWRFLTCSRDGETIMTAVLRFTAMLPGRYIVNAPRGPVVRHPAALDEGLEAMTTTLARLGATTLMVNPRWADADAAAVEEVLARHGFTVMEAEDQTMHTATGILDLSLPPEQLLANMKQRCRRSLRASEALGVEVRRLSPADDLSPYASLWDDFVARKGFDAGGLPDLRGQMALVERLGGVVLALHYDGACLGLHTVVRHGDRAYFLTAATSDRHPDVPKAYLLIWQAILAAREMGCRQYDFAGLPDGEPRDAAERNRAQFKTGFGPVHTRLCRRHAKALAPLQHALLYAVWRRRTAIRQRLAALAGPLRAAVVRPGR